MTVGHLVFALGMLGYILVAIQLEERDLVREYGRALSSPTASGCAGSFPSPPVGSRNGSGE
jgi:hypothetical protein